MAPMVFTLLVVPKMAVITSREVFVPQSELLSVRAALEELGVEGERVQMYHLPRGLHPEFVAKGKEMDARIRDLGPSPFLINLLR